MTIFLCISDKFPVFKNHINNCIKMSKIIKNKLTKEAQDLDTETCKTLLKDILKDLNNWENSRCLWLKT